MEIAELVKSGVGRDPRMMLVGERKWIGNKSGTRALVEIHEQRWVGKRKKDNDRDPRVVARA